MATHALHEVFTDTGASAVRPEGRAPAHRVSTPPMSEWAESRRGYMTPGTIEMNARLHAADAPKSARAHVNGGESGIEFQGYSTPGVAL